MNKETVVIEEHSTIGFGHNPNAEQKPNNQDCYGCSGVRICLSLMQLLLQYFITHDCDKAPSLEHMHLQSWVFGMFHFIQHHGQSWSCFLRFFVSNLLASLKS